MSPSCCFALILTASLTQQAPTTTPASQPSPPLLSGPNATEKTDGTPTLVTPTFDGRVESVGPEPDAVAIAMLDLTAEQKSKFTEIDSSRKSTFDDIVRSNYGLMLELATLQAEQSAVRRGDILQAVTAAFRPYADRGSFFQEMWPHLTDAQRQQTQAMVKEYRDARHAAFRRELSGQAPAAIAARDRVENFGQMIRESIERQIGLEQEQFERIAEELELTIEQRNAAEAIFQPIAIKRFQKIEVTREEQAAAFAEFNRLLSAGQKQKALGILLRQYQQPPQSNVDEVQTPKEGRSESNPHA